MALADRGQGLPTGRRSTDDDAVSTAETAAMAASFTPSANS
jgi:hypothetical protein